MVSGSDRGLRDALEALAKERQGIVWSVGKNGEFKAACRNPDVFMDQCNGQSWAALLA